MNDLPAVRTIPSAPATADCNCLVVFSAPKMAFAAITAAAVRALKASTNPAIPLALIVVPKIIVARLANAVATAYAFIPIPSSVIVPVNVSTVMVIAEKTVALSSIRFASFYKTGTTAEMAGISPAPIASRASDRLF